MLEMVKSDKLVTDSDMCKKYPNCKFVLVDIDDDCINPSGRLYCISHSSDSWLDLLESCKEVELAGRQYAISGSYADAFAYGLQMMAKVK